MKGVPKGDALLTVVHPRFGTYTREVRLPCDDQVFRFSKLGELSGRLMDGPRPAAPAVPL